MNLIRKSAWAVVMLGAVAGCTSDERDDQPRRVRRPICPRPPRNRWSRLPTETSKEGASKEMPPAPKADTKKPDESPKLEPPKADRSPRPRPNPRPRPRPAPPPPSSRPTRSPTIKQLPAADQELALKQAVCPVSDEHLGEMGKPVKMTAEGRTFFLCCEGCEEEVKERPQGGHRQAGRQGGEVVSPAFRSRQPSGAGPGCLDALILSSRLGSGGAPMLAIYSASTSDVPPGPCAGSRIASLPR